MIGTKCYVCGGTIGVIDDCYRCTSCESLPTKKDVFTEE